MERESKLDYHQLQIYRINVGQGDSGIALFSHKRPGQIEHVFASLIDAGLYHASDSNMLGKNLHRKLNFCLGPGKSLDMVILSHLDQDHFKGLVALLDRREFCMSLQQLIRRREQIYQALDSRTKLLSKQRMQVQQLIDMLNRYARMISVEDRISSLNSVRTRSDTAQHYIQVKTRIDHFIELFCQKDDRLAYETNICINDQTRIVLPYCCNKEERESLEEITAKMGLLNRHRPIWGEDLWDKEYLHELFPVLKEHDILTFVPISQSKSPKKEQSSPQKSQRQREHTKNERSLATLFQFNGFRYLTCGDLPEKGLADVTKQLQGRRVQFLQCPHHGAKGHISKSLIQKLNPYAVFLSFGGNLKFRHPHIETISFLQGRYVYCHCDPTQTNSVLLQSLRGRLPQWLIVTGQGEVYDHHRAPVTLQSDIKLLIKGKNTTAKVIYYQSSHGVTLVCQDRFGKSQPCRAQEGRIARQELFRKDKVKIRSKLRLDQEGDYQLVVTKGKNGDTLSIVEDKSLLATKKVIQLPDRTYLIRWAEAVEQDE